jgi:putative SOS response-associated peptidase YedK
MCGRFTLATPVDQLALAFPWLSIPSELPPRYNVAPSQPVAVVANTNRKLLEYYRWGLIPSWAQDPAIGNRMINARAETVAVKPAFSAAFRRRRCLVLADGFYEWQRAPGRTTKQPHYIRLASGEPFGFAGLWEVWRAPDGSVILSCAIITTQPNDLVAQIHDRMPVILPSDAYECWLDPSVQEPVALQPWLVPYPAEGMVAHPVGTLVNNPRNDLADCIAPATAALG